MDTQKHTYLEAGFKLINRNIEELFGMKDELKGFWIFKSHKYSSDELFKSPQYGKIVSTAEKIADDIKNWKDNGKLDIGTTNVYNVNRELLKEKLIDLENEVKNREPTWWDNVKDFFSRFITYMKTILPRITFKMLSNIAEGTSFLAGPAKKLLNATQKIQRALISKDDIYITEKS